MQTVTNEQIYDRWEHVPESLKEAFFSTDNGVIVWKAGEDAGLSEDSIDAVLLVVGNILLGFTPINDFASELRSIPGMDPKAVDPIIFQIDKRVFEPVKSDILRLYEKMAGPGPRIVAEAAPEAITKTSVDMGSAMPTMVASEASRPATVETATEVEIRKVRIGEELPAPVSTEAEQPTAPAMIHAEAELKPVAQTRRALSSFGGMFGFGRAQERKKESTGITAEVSMVEGLGERPQEIAKTEQRPVRVVHYTSAKEPEDIFATTTPIQQEALPLAPVTKQEHEVDFEPKVIDLTASEPLAEADIATHAEPVPAPAREEEAQKPSRNASAQPAPTIPAPVAVEAPVATVMKTPQRVETVAQQSMQAPPKLADIPVSADAIDLRTLEGVENKK